MVDPENYCTQANREVYFYNCLHGKQEFSEHRVPFVFGNDFHTGKWGDPDDPSFWEIWIDVPVFEHANFRYYRRYYGYNPDDYTDGSHFIAKFPQYAGKVIPFLHYWKLFEPEKYREVMTDLIVSYPEKYIDHEECKNLSGAQWVEILHKHPEYMYKMDVKHFTDEDWGDLFFSYPALAENYDINCIHDGRIIGVLLTEYPQWIDRFDWQTVHTWNELLKKQPQLIDKAPEQVLYFDGDHAVWWDLLKVQPQFVSKCPYESLSIAGNFIYSAVSALEVHPELVSLIDWSVVQRDGTLLDILCNIFNFPLRENILPLLVEKTIVAKEWDLSDFSGAGWAILLIKCPGLAEFCDWDKVNEGNWCGWVLEEQPQFADKCDWSKLNGGDWCRLLQEQPQFADKCDWSKLNGSDWGLLLQEQPQFADKCDWSKLNGSDWGLLLQERPQFADKCDWSKLNGSDWGLLLQERPQFADKCDWSKLNGGNWCWLLREQPQFADKCDWSKCTREDLFYLADKQPDILNMTIKSGNLQEETMLSILFTHPEFADRVNLSKMNGMDLVTLFYNQPQIFENRNLADLCRWEDLHGLFWCKFLSEHPEYAAYCDWNKLTEEHWPELLFFQPQFADRCDWSELPGAHIELLLQEHPQLEKYCHNETGRMKTFYAET